MTEHVLYVQRHSIMSAQDKTVQKVSWEETYRSMSFEQEDWSDFDVALFDGLADEPWSLQEEDDNVGSHCRRYDRLGV